LNRSCTNVCPVKIDIHEQIYLWREVMEDRDQIKIVKKEAMIVVGKVLSSPKLYRIAMSSTETALTILPDFAIYNPLNYWGKHRDVPDAADKTFHEWYKSHRLKANEALGL
jgi:L-lactate dehydrogenase complex protein LldF